VACSETGGVPEPPPLTYWISAAAVCEASTAYLRAETKLAVRDWIDKGEKPTASWWATNEARHIIEQIKAAILEKALYIR